MKRFGVQILLLVVLCAGLSGGSIAQSYRVEITLTGRTFTTNCFPSMDDAHIVLGGQAAFADIENIPLNTKIFDKTYAARPTGNLTITSRIVGTGCGTGSGRCYPGSELNGSYSLDWSSARACNTQGFPLNGTCRDDARTITVSLQFQVKWTPIHSPNQVQVAQNDVCENEAANLNIASSLTGYTWRFRDSSNPTFRPLNTSQGTASSVNVTIDEIYGSSYGIDKLGSANNINFEATIGGCPGIATGNPVHFQPGPPGVLPEAQGGFTLTPRECSGVRDSVIVNSLSRIRFPGETFTVKVFRKDDNVRSVPALMEKPSVTTFPVLFTNLEAGEYKFLITSSLQCLEEWDKDYPKTLFTISNFDPVSVTPVTTNVTCFGESNGSITVNATGGTGSGYEYAIKDKTGFSPVNVFNGLLPANYSLLVKDGKGCAAAETPAGITQPTQVRITAASSPYTHRGSQLTCVGATDATINVTASGGTGLLTYSVNGADFFPALTGIGAGSYTVSARDEKLCTTTFPNVTVTPPLAITATATPVNPLCFSDPAGINVTASGGTGALRYSFDGTNYTLPPPPFNNLSLSAYTVYIQDENFCTITRPVTIMRPKELVITPAITKVTCFGGTDGSVTLGVAEGTTPYTYKFNTGNFGTANSLAGLAATNHTYVVRDKNGCEKNGNFTIDSNPLITGAIAVQAPISCFGRSDGVLSMTPNGGVSPYTYAWSNGSTAPSAGSFGTGTHTVTVTDSKGCPKEFSQLLSQPQEVMPTYVTSNYGGKQVRCFGGTDGSIDLSVTGGTGAYTYSWSNGSTAPDLFTLGAGTYTITVRDSRNCSGTTSVILTQPAQLVSTPTLQNVFCNGASTGSITFAASGGISTYRYSIDNGANWQSSASFTELPAGIYPLITEDANNCRVSESKVITAPTPIVLLVNNIVNTTCNQENGSAIASATGGVATYSYEWLNSSAQRVGTTASINNLSAGIYQVIVTDQNACTKNQSVPISSSNGPDVTTGTITAATCADKKDGSASINITGGTAPYTIQWPEGQSVPAVDKLAGGEYIVQVRDQAGCLALKTITVPAPQPLILNSVLVKDPNCNGNSDGAIMVAASGGNGTYIYAWSTGAVTPAIAGLRAGTYSISVADIKNCEASAEVRLIEPPVFSIDLGADRKICEGMNVTLKAPQQGIYRWTGDNGFTSNLETVVLTEAGTYTLNVINAKGCEAKDSFVLSYDVNLLKADFLMASKAYAGDTIMLIEISWPMPEQVTWSYAAGTTVIEESQFFSMVRFDEPGEYAVNLLARLAQCTNRSEQHITILDAQVEEEPAAKEADKIVQRVSAYPNPAPDEVSVSVELTENRPISLELYQAVTNKRVYHESLSDETRHVRAINLSSLPRGMYILYIRTGKEVRSVKIIKQ